MVYKVGKHYDGVIQLQNNESYCSEIISVNQWEYLLHSACNNIDRHVTADDMHCLDKLSKDIMGSLFKDYDKI